MAGIADIQRPDLRPHRPAARDRAEARRDPEGRAEQPLQAHASCSRTSARTCSPWSTGCPAPSPSTGSSARGSTTRSRSSCGAPAFRLQKAEADAHILRGYLKALDMLDEVIALIRRSPTADEARDGLIDAARRGPGAGHRDPQPAAAPPRRPRAAADHRPGRRARAPDRRVQGHPRDRRRASGRSSRRS